MIAKDSFDGSLQTKGAFFRKARLGEVQDQIAESVKKYSDPAAGRIRPDLTVERACLVCDGKDSRILFRKNFFPHVKCLGCGFVFVNPILKEELLVEYYTEISGSWADVTEDPEYTAFQTRYSNFHLDQIEKNLTGSSRTLLDIGCNNGAFLEVARSRGWTVTGHELNTYAVQKARAKGLEVIDQKLNAEAFDGRKFDAVTLFGVLEHLPYPQEILGIVKTLLRSGGVLGTLVPNIDSIATRILQDRCNTFDGIEHVNFWSPQTLTKFLKRAGFDPAAVETTISEVYTLNNYLHLENPYACPEEHPMLLEFLTPDYIHQHQMGHHLCAYSVAR